MSTSRRGSLQAEIKQSRPFRSPGQEATLALRRTASVIGRVIGRVIEPYGLSLAQYNALRIIRGAGTNGIPTLAIRDRMVEEGTTITRLLDKLETAGYIRRERSVPDRRQVICYVVPDGKKLMDELDPLVDDADAEVMSALSASQLDQLIDLLDIVRAANAEKGAPRSDRSSTG